MSYSSADHGIKFLCLLIFLFMFPDLWNQSTDAEAATEKLQGDVKSGIETILHRGSGILEKAKAEFGSHSEATRSNEPGKLHSFKVIPRKMGSNLARFMNL